MCLSINPTWIKCILDATKPNNLQVNHVIHNCPCFNVVSLCASVVEIYLKVLLLYEFTLRLFFFISNSNSLNPFLANVPISYPLKSPGNQRSSAVFRGGGGGGGVVKMGTLARNGLNNLSPDFLYAIQKIFTYSKSAIETLEKGVKYI